MMRSVFLLALAGGWCLAADRAEMDRIREVPDPERRSKQALAYARSRLEAAFRAYQEGESEKGRASLLLIAESVEMATEALQATGKRPSRSPRHFKHAEIATRRLLAELRRGRRAVILQDQADFDETIRRVEAANNTLLRGILSSGR